MKSKVFILCAVMIVTTFTAVGQTTMISTGSDLMLFINSDLDYIENQADRYGKIEGSAYLDESFREGAISFNRKRYVGLNLRYNQYEGTFEFETDDGIRFFDPEVILVDTVWMAGDTYLYILYQSGKARKRSFMKLINYGATRVLYHHQVLLMDPEPAKGYEEARPARFEQRPETLFVQLPGQPAMEFRGKKSVEEIFPDDHQVLAEYIKSNRLKLKRVEDVTKLCRYFDSLR